MEQQLTNKIIEFINNGWELIADDTHRWVESDGFYEVQFELHKDSNKIYLHTESGGQDLEDEWSESNPQQVNPETVINTMRDDFDIKYAFEQIAEFKEA